VTTASNNAASPAPIVIGQDNPIIQSIEQGLISVGVQVAEASLATAEPWTQLPIVKWLVDEGIKFGITQAVQEVDLIGYQIYVSVTDSEKVSNFVAEQADGSQSQIDQAFEELVDLGDV
jgi:hypothetical protein